MKQIAPGDASGPQWTPEQRSESTLGISDVFKVVRRRQRFLTALSVLTIIGVIAGHVLYVPTFTSVAIVQVQEHKSDSANLILDQASLGGPSKNEEELQRFLRYSSTDTFFLKVAEAIKYERRAGRLKLFDPHALSMRNPVFWRFWMATLVKDREKQDELTRPLDPLKTPVEVIAATVRGMVRIESDEQKLQISFKTTSLDAFTSSFLGNLVANTFVESNTRLGQEELVHVENFVKERMGEVLENLKKSESELVTLKKKYNIVASDSEGIKTSLRLRDVENKLETARIEFQENEKLLSLYRSSGEADSPEGVVSGEETAVMEREFEELREKVRAIKEKGVEKSPELTEANRRLVSVARALRDRNRDAGSAPAPVARIKIRKLESSNDVLRSKIDALSRAKDTLANEMKEFPEAEQRILNVQRQVELSYANYSNLQRKLEGVEIQKISYQATLKLQQVAKEGGADPRPNILLKIIFGILVSLFIGISLSLLLEVMDTTVKHKSDLEALSIGFLGEVPNLKNASLPNKVNATLCSIDQVVCLTDPVSPEAMAFTFIRARLESLRGLEGKPHKVFTITSVNSGDGKSMVASNLAVSLAQVGRKVVILDCDFRKPSLHCYLEQPNNVGLVDLLSMKASFDEVIASNVVRNLDFMPSGLFIGDPSELISTDRMKLLLEHLREIYDFIIIDTPPINAVVDSAIISSIADKVVLVASYRKTTRQDFLIAYQRILQISQKKVHGILNRVDSVSNIIAYYSYPYSRTANVHKDGKRKPHKGSAAPIEETGDFREHLKRKSASGDQG